MQNLSLRFGALPEAVRSRITACTLKEFQSRAERLAHWMATDGTASIRLNMHG